MRYNALDGHRRRRTKRLFEPSQVTGWGIRHGAEADLTQGPRGLVCSSEFPRWTVRAAECGGCGVGTAGIASVLVDLVKGGAPFKIDRGRTRHPRRRLRGPARLLAPAPSSFESLGTPIIQGPVHPRGPAIRLLTCLDPVASWLMSSIAGPSVAGGRSAGSIGSADDVDRTASRQPGTPPRQPAPTPSRGNRRRSQHAGQPAAPRDPTTLTVKGSASSDRPPARFARDEHQTGSNRPKPSRTATRTRSGSLTPFRVRTRPAPVSLQFA